MITKIRIILFAGLFIPLTSIAVKVVEQRPIRKIDAEGCLKALPIKLSKTQKIRLCKNSNLDAVECFNAATIRISDDQKIALCSDGGTVKNVHCYDDASISLETDERIELCRNQK